MIKVYKEEGGAWLVTVLGQFEGKDGLSYTWLECLREILPSPQQGSIAAGEQWDVSVLPGHQAYVGWSLLEPNPKDLELL